MADLNFSAVVTVEAGDEVTVDLTGLTPAFTRLSVAGIPTSAETPPLGEGLVVASPREFVQGRVLPPSQTWPAGVPDWYGTYLLKIAGADNQYEDDVGPSNRYWFIDGDSEMAIIRADPLDTIPSDNKSPWVMVPSISLSGVQLEFSRGVLGLVGYDSGVYINAGGVKIEAGIEVMEDHAGGTGAIRWYLTKGGALLYENSIADYPSGVLGSGVLNRISLDFLTGIQGAAAGETSPGYFMWYPDILGMDPGENFYHPNAAFFENIPLDQPWEVGIYVRGGAEIDDIRLGGLIAEDNDLWRRFMPLSFDAASNFTSGFITANLKLPTPSASEGPPTLSSGQLVFQQATDPIDTTLTFFRAGSRVIDFPTVLRSFEAATSWVSPATTTPADPTKGNGRVGFQIVNCATGDVLRLGTQVFYEEVAEEFQNVQRIWLNGVVIAELVGAVGDELPTSLGVNIVEGTIGFTAGTEGVDFPEGDQRDAFLLGGYFSYGLFYTPDEAENLIVLDDASGSVVRSLPLEVPNTTDDTLPVPSITHGLSSGPTTDVFVGAPGVSGEYADPLDPTQGYNGYLKVDTPGTYLVSADIVFDPDNTTGIATAADTVHALLSAFPLEGGDSVDSPEQTLVLSPTRGDVLHIEWETELGVNTGVSVVWWVEHPSVTDPDTVLIFPAGISVRVEPAAT